MMKLVNYRLGEQIRLGIKTEQGVVDVEQAAALHSLEAPITMEQVVAAGETGQAKLAQILNNKAQTIHEKKLVYAPCVTNPEKILCVGLNYLSHREECDEVDLPPFPILFSKFNNALAAHNQTIKLPNKAEKVDYEAELVIVIGKEAINVSKEDAPAYIFGYTVGNDLSARDLQKRTAQWLLGKTCDSFAPIGPWIVTADEVDSGNLDISCSVNGVIRQSANTRDMIFDCATIVSYASTYMTLKPGDIIFTGTPSGVIMGYPEEKQKWLTSGDIITISIEKIGTLQNTLK
ncbi:MAG: Ureidoglycolate lyase [Firmicutes bacterium]|nr:Ureidoglycolate lyase [Bacillota bacterium]